MAAGRLTDDVAVLDHLVLATTTIDLLAAAHAERDPETPMKAHRDAALHSLLKRLAEGVLAAWSTCSHFIYNGPVRDGDPPYDPDDLRSYFHEEGPPKLIPPIFWQCLTASEPACKVCDLVTGDFSFAGVRFADGNCYGSAFAVYFDLRGLPAEAIPPDHYQVVQEIKTLMATDEAAATHPSTNTEAKEEKKPVLSEADLRRWWDELGDHRERIARDALWNRCKEAFPSHSIARKRVRDLPGARKKGPKGPRPNNAKNDAAK